MGRVVIPKEVYQRQSCLPPNLHKRLHRIQPAVAYEVVKKKDIHRGEINMNMQRQIFAIKKAGEWIEVDKTDLRQSEDLISIYWNIIFVH